MRTSTSRRLRPSRSRSLSAGAAIAGLVLLSGNAGAAPRDERPAPDPRWSRIYMLESTNVLRPAPPTRRHSSFVRTRSMVPQDSPDAAVLPSSVVTQSENSAFVDPNDPNVVLVSTNTSNWNGFSVTQFYGTGTYWTTDGGATWTGNDFGPGGVGNSGDPAAVIRGIDGRWIVGYISSGFGQGVSYTDDRGATWSHVNIFPGGTLDKNHLMVDNVPTSPHYGNVYSAWTAFTGVDVNDIQFVRSTDGGATWPAVATNISAGVFSGSHDQGINVQVGPGGEVYAAWAIYDSWPSNETAIGLNRSTDGGATWTGEFRAITGINGHRNTNLPNTAIRRNSFPSMAVDVSGGPNNGAVYIVWTNQGVPGINVGDTDIYVAKSTDGGSTFGTPVRVNQDTTTNAQWFPWIACDPTTGVLAVIFQDRRDDPADTMARAYMATSADGGVTWEDFAVGDVGFTPTPISGLASGYMGDYLGMALSGARAYPTWSDNRTGNVLCYVSPILVADPTNPNPPTNVTAFSDYQTPTSVRIDWTDPTTFPDGTPLGDFSIDILRDSVFVANVNQGIGTYTDPALTDGQFYQYLVRSHDDVTDSVSTSVAAAAWAGGSPTPAAPTALICASDTVSASLSWTDPTTQDDGTTLDDFAGVRVYRDGSLLIELARAATDTGSVDSYVDFPPPGFVYTYEVSAIDSEAPPNESARTSGPFCFVGDIPGILVWQPADVVSTSGDSLLAVLQGLGESVVLTDSLFKFAPDLNVHEAVFACVGVSPNNHVIDAVEGAALDNLVQDGGRLYLEGADCFNNDPEAAGGYNVRPIFGLVDGPIGTADLLGVVGLNDLGGFQMAYAGPNVQIDELQPSTSTAVFQNDANTDLVTVYKTGYFLGRAIGASYEFGGLVDGAGSTKAALVASYLAFFRVSGNPVQTVIPGSVSTTIYQDATDTQSFAVGNPGTASGDLTFAVTESPAVGWVSATPTGGTVTANGSSTISVDFDATGLLPGTFVTDLIVTGNDPVNLADTVMVTLDVLGIPALSAAPGSLHVRIPSSAQLPDSLTLTNTGLGDLVYDLVILGGGGVQRDEFNAAADSLLSSTEYRGNVYQVDIGLHINRIDHQLDIPAATELEFFVYESPSTASQYVKKFSTTVVSGTGRAWYSSGAIDVRLEAGKTYYIGCGWQGTVTALRDDAQNMPQSITFGNLVSSGGTSGYPPPDSTFVSAAGQIIWDQAIEYGFPLDVSFVSATVGTLTAGASSPVVIDFGAGQQLGSFPTLLNVNHNIPNTTGTDFFPITIEVIDMAAVDAGVTVALPSAFALHPSAPNPLRRETRIRFDLPQAVRVRLSVFDVTGRLVRRLTDRPQPAGYHTVIWDGRDGDGRRVGSGVYFYSMETPGKSFRRKVVVLR